MAAALFLSVQVFLCLIAERFGGFGLGFPFLGIGFCLTQAVGVLIGRIALKRLQAGPGSGQNLFGLRVIGLGQDFCVLGLLQIHMGLVASFARLVEPRLGLPELSGLTSRHRACIRAVALFEVIDGTFQ